MKDFLKKVFLYCTNKLVIKNFEIKNYFKRKEIDKKWDQHFQGKLEIIHQLNSSLKIKLYRNSKLTEYILFHDFEKAELSFFNKYLQAGDFVIDIGANIGFHTIHASKIIGDSGKVFAFEPVAKTFMQLQENINLNHLSNVELFKLGFSDSTGYSEINTSEYFNAWNTLASKDKMNRGDANKFDKTEIVKLERLDEWAAKNIVEIDRVSLIKVDVEGWEKFVVLGGENFFQTCSGAIMMEFSENNASTAGYKCQEVFNMIIDFGFSWFEYNEVVNKLILVSNQSNFDSKNLIAIKLGSNAAKRLKEIL